MQLFVLVLVGVVAVGCAGPGSSGDDRVLPDETLQFVQGGDYPLRQQGEPRVLNLWATWCTPCRAELPAFDDVAARVQGIEIVGVNTGQSGPEAQELIDQLDLTFPQVLDPTARLQQGLRIVGMPATVFVDEDGSVVDVHSGELTREELEALLVEHFDADFS